MPNYHAGLISRVFLRSSPFPLVSAHDLSHGEMFDNYERGFRSLLWRVRARRLQLGVQRLQAKAQGLMASGQTTESACQAVYARARHQVIAHLARGREARRRQSQEGRSSSLQLEHTLQLFASLIPESPPAESADFHCDSGLGGLARWLRAAGYDARFWPQIADDELLRITQPSSAILLTTDGLLMRRASVQWGGVPALLAPLQAGRQGQFEFVAERLALPRKPARCMTCGGGLKGVAKESVRERIPPRTFPWRDDYYLCLRCGKLFWDGTHWERVVGALARVFGTAHATGG